MDENSVDAETEHIVMAKSESLTAVRNLMGELDAVKNTKKTLKQRKQTLQNEEQQHQEEIERLQALRSFKKQQQQKHTYPKKKKITGHNANTNCTIVSSKIDNDTNIVSSSTSNIHNIQLDESPLIAETEDRLCSNEQEVET